MEEKIFFYYTSDIHSHFENWTKVIQFLNQKKIQRQRENQDYFILDNGDHVDRVHIIAEALLGKANVQLLNHANYDVATLGNNEGITLDYNDLFHLYDEANFKVVCANLQSNNKHNPEWLEATHQLTTKSGVTIGIIGLTAPFNAFYNLLGWHVASPFETLDKHIKQLADESDIVILLSHLGINEDEEIARRYPEVDVIVGGHTHHLFRTGEYINKTLLSAAGKHGKYVGEVILTWNHQREMLVKKEAYTTNIDHLEKDQVTIDHIEKFTQTSNALLERSIITLTEPLEVDWFKETTIIRHLVETLKDWTKADCALLNAGVILDRLEAGPVSYGDIHRICPHPINPCVVELKGNELLEVVRGSYTKALMELELKGFGFRGKVIGRMVFAGLEVELVEKEKEDIHVKSVMMNGEPLQKDKLYKVATPDMFTFGKLLPEISRAKSKQFFMPELLRDLLVETLKKFK
ncbi:bifunctional metallophosphatase/5'-nucleotidase [Aquibacillus koreensis]|uniref:Bifunctional metallophosphatase/5'-nucleotidase n=1 Tax=Aquibacillus koreensis TaxID=279446 RepID=A0A9X3WN64_9BACI|nr:bifunctional UDP-sugar hydrolase/5'-nucleotidase [Aquibacillus koreensis]MCT2535918.1 bifunctional metallophosphatase/5'-nucleotidase [Aquibacillus koreensis]MDC3420374.1 bifunctional metallophosphatase/5'-nucleotidase [Aquibacillus koreensis]